MSNYRRFYRPGGVWFFTIVTHRRAPILTTDLGRRCLHDAIAECRKSRPFDLTAMVLLPDHLHCIWTLAETDHDFSSRWSFIKSHFTRNYLAAGGRESAICDSRREHQERGVWQRRFWEHLIRDNDDLNNHLDYIHYNPIKHNLCACAHAWPHSSFSRWVESGGYEPTWQCGCDARHPEPPKFDDMGDLELE